MPKTGVNKVSTIETPINKVAKPYTPGDTYATLFGGPTRNVLPTIPPTTGETDTWDMHAVPDVPSPPWQPPPEPLTTAPTAPTLAVTARWQLPKSEHKSLAQYLRTLLDVEETDAKAKMFEITLTRHKLAQSLREKMDERGWKVK